MNPATQRQALKAAAYWHAKLGGNPQCAITAAQWRAWHAADPVNGWAWQQLEQFQDGLNGLSGALARHTLAASSMEPPRRTLLKGLVLGCGLAGLGWAGFRQSPLWLADQRTATGEWRSLLLEDGTRLALNTATSVNISFDAQQRLIVLLEGEIFVETGHDSRPLHVRSKHGTMRPLGTRFNVRTYPGHTELVVVEHAVAVHNAATTHSVQVDAGMALAFDRDSLPTPRVADVSRTEWSQGRLVFDDWRLDQALAELQRYRGGVVRCTEAIAGLRVSGVYPLGDTDRILAAMAKALDLRIETRTRFWVTLTAAT